MFAVIECLFTRVWARAKKYVQKGFLSQENVVVFSRSRGIHTDIP